MRQRHMGPGNQHLESELIKCEYHLWEHFMYLNIPTCGLVFVLQSWQVGGISMRQSKCEYFFQNKHQKYILALGNFRVIPGFKLLQKHKNIHFNFVRVQGEVVQTA